MSQKMNLVGQKYGRLTVLEHKGTKPLGKNNRVSHIWKCICDCGKQKIVATYCLRNGSVQSCGCLHKDAMASSCWTGCGEMSGRYWGQLKANALKRNHSFELTIEEGWSLFEKQERKCALTGVPISFLRTGRKQEASLDRIDSSKGYMANNTQWVHKVVNLMKNTLSNQEFVDWCFKVAKHNANN